MEQEMSTGQYEGYEKYFGANHGALGTLRSIHSCRMWIIRS